MNKALHFYIIAAILLSTALIIACNDEDDFYSCGCQEDGDTEEADAERLGEVTEESEDEGQDGDADSMETEPESEESGESDAEEEAFIPADCILDVNCTRVMVAAHRGYHATYPDNTLAAVRAAFELGADLAEVDVMETADEVLVLSHENDLSFVTDGTGQINQSNWDDIKNLNMKNGDQNNPESMHLGLFLDALAMAREYGKMLYVDVKTGRGDLIVAAIRSEGYYREALVRDDFAQLVPMMTLDSGLIVMPPVKNADEFDAIMTQAAPSIVEIALVVPKSDLASHIIDSGVKIQQDVMGYGDLKVFAGGDYSGWKEFIEAGVLLLQTDMPDLLVPAVRHYNESGEFPASAPGE